MADRDPQPEHRSQARTSRHLEKFGSRLPVLIRNRSRTWWIPGSPRSSGFKPGRHRVLFPASRSCQPVVPAGRASRSCQPVVPAGRASRSCQPVVPAGRVSPRSLPPHAARHPPPLCDQMDAGTIVRGGSVTLEIRCPVLGEDADGVLAECGYDPADGAELTIAALRSRTPRRDAMGAASQSLSTVLGEPRSRVRGCGLRRAKALPATESDAGAARRPQAL